MSIDEAALNQDLLKEIISKTTLHQQIPFPLDASDFVKLYFGKERERSVSYVEFSQFLHDFHDEYAMVGFKAKDKTGQVRSFETRSLTDRLQFVNLCPSINRQDTPFSLFAN